ncbi:uncharacterized protein Dana_GF27185, isoform B [Drosophila ananassae]|uniref:Uncharacterized protein, isoform B n=1 Tax=Drosophila ananassae TaxID=7217 RepID=A0A0P8XRC9_DROAN|nr:axoneme-associated protein mst101(2) isoform X2 [Drosophila ananassae]KPU77115.1 uncharacterized protein Dana_GF27185, isoform B [Drosophila ananassae]
MLRRCIGRQMQCLLAFPRPPPLIQATSCCQRYISRGPFFGPSFFQGQIKWIEKKRPPLGPLQFDPPMSCDILCTDVNEPGPSGVSKQVRQVQQRVCLVGQVRRLSDKGPAGPKKVSVCMFSRKGKLYHKDNDKKTMETCLDKRNKCLCDKWRPRPRPKKRKKEKNIRKRLEELMEEGPERSFENEHLKLTAPKNSNERHPSRSQSDDSDSYYDCEEPKFTISNFINMLREKSEEIKDQLREGKLADHRRRNQQEDELILKYKDLYEKEMAKKVRSCDGSSVTNPPPIQKEPPQSVSNPNLEEPPKSQACETEEPRACETEEPKSILRPTSHQFETRKQVKLDQLVNYVREKNKEAMNNLKGCDKLIKECECQVQGLASAQNSKKPECPEAANKEGKHPYPNYVVKYERYWPKSKAANHKQEKNEPCNNDTPRAQISDSSNSEKYKIDMADFKGKLERCERLQVQIADMVSKCISLVMGNVEKEPQASSPKKSAKKEDDHSFRYQRNCNEPIQSTDAIGTTKSSDKRLGGKETSILKSPETTSSIKRIHAKLYSSQKVDKPPSQYLTQQVDNIIRQCEDLKNEFEMRLHSTFSKSSVPNAGSNKAFRKQSPVEMEMRRRCTLDALKKKCEDAAIKKEAGNDEEDDEVEVLRKKQAELKKRLEKAKLKKQCALIRKAIEESEDDNLQGPSEVTFLGECRAALKSRFAREDQRRKWAESYLREKIEKIKRFDRSLSSKRSPTQLGFTQKSSIELKKNQVDPVMSKKCDEEEFIKKSAEEDFKKKVAQKDLKKKCAEEELNKKCAEVELKEKCAKEELKNECAKKELKKTGTREELKKKCAEAKLKKKCAEEELKKKCSEEELKKKCAEEALKKKCAKEELKKKCAEDELKRKCAEEKLKKKCAEDELKRKCAKEELKKKCAEDELKKKCAEEKLKKKCAEEALKKKCSEDELKKKCAEEELKKKCSEEDLKKKCAADERKRKNEEMQLRLKCFEAKLKKKCEKIKNDELKEKNTEESLKNKGREEELKKKDKESSQEKLKTKSAKDEKKKRAEEEKKKLYKEKENNKSTEKDFKKKCDQAALKEKCAEEELKKKCAEEELKKECEEEEMKKKCAEEEMKKKCAEEELKEKCAEEELKKKCAKEELKKKCAEEELKNKCAEEEKKKKRAEEALKKKCAEEKLKKKCSEEMNKKKLSEKEVKEKSDKEELKKKGKEEDLKKESEEKPKTAALGIRNKENDCSEIYKDSQIQENRLMGELKRWWEEVDRNTKNIGGVPLNEHESEEIHNWLKRQKEKDTQAGKAKPRCAGPKDKGTLKLQSLDGIFLTSGLTSNRAPSSRGLLDALCDPLPRLRKRVHRNPSGFPPLTENIIGSGCGHGIIQHPEPCRIPLLGPNIFVRQILPRLKPLSINGNLRVYWLDAMFSSTTFSRRGYTRDESGRYSSLVWPYATFGGTNSDDESQK